MIDNYPNAEQTWFIRDLLYRASTGLEILSDEEKDLYEKFIKLINQADEDCKSIAELASKSIDAELANNLRDALCPFERSGVLFLDSGHFAEYGTNRIHEMLQGVFAKKIIQQQTMFEDDGSLDEEIKGFLKILGEKLGISGMTFDNHPK